ncbi:MAG: hypothetical protein RLO81_09520 [Fulvivirga sp.]|uniref:hypothetical protein n=1 Tax=Fulvivirga sp. TaxID=1931237 RepID=UPI0032F03013
MKLQELQRRAELEQDKKYLRAYTQFNQLLAELTKKELPEAILNSINQGIEDINASKEEGKPARKLIRKTQTNILKALEKELKLVPKNHYRNTWLAVGMTVFGIPLGIAFGSSMDSMAYLGVGLPIGMAIGMAVGASMDKKAFEEGRQLDVDIEL